MEKDRKGKPSGVNKEESLTGVPSNTTPGKMDQNKDISEKYTREENEAGDNVRTSHPNRNTDKQNPTQTGGYKS